MYPAVIPATNLLLEELASKQARLKAGALAVCREKNAAGALAIPISRCATQPRVRGRHGSQLTDVRWDVQHKTRRNDARNETARQQLQARCSESSVSTDMAFDLRRDEVRESYQVVNHNFWPDAPDRPRPYRRTSNRMK